MITARNSFPSSVTMLLLIVLTHSGFHAIRFGTAIAEWHILSEFLPAAMVWYIAGSGLLWAVTGLLLFVNIWSAKPAAIRLTLILAATYTLWYWADRLWIKHDQSSGLFNLTLTALLWVTLGTIATHPTTKIFFTKREKHD